MFPFLEPHCTIGHCGEPVVGRHARIGGAVVYPGWIMEARCIMEARFIMEARCIMEAYG